MVDHDLRTADRIARKDRIPKSEQTSDRDAVADWIEENAAEEWSQWTFSAIADATGYSRQHIANTVRAYFAPLDEETGELPLDDLSERELRIYRRGYRDGFQDGVGSKSEQ